MKKPLWNEFKRRKRMSIILIFVLILFIYENFENYDNIIRENIDILLADPNFHPTEEQFIMFRCDSKLDTHNCGGHADRLKGIMSLYLWSLISNRSLLIHVTRPCNMVNLLEPNEVKWNREIKFSENEIGTVFRHGDPDFRDRLASINFTRFAYKFVPFLQKNIFLS